MNDVTQIEQQLKKKVDAEIKLLVTSWIGDLKTLGNNYGRNNFYKFALQASKSNIEKKEWSCLDISLVEEIFTDLIKDAYGEYMLRGKTKTLLDKLELL